jgi:hypothetical protein
MFGQDPVLMRELENVTWNTTNWIQGIDDTVSLIGTSARQLEEQREEIHVAIPHLMELRDAIKHYFNQTANVQVDDLQVVNLALVHETKIEQSHGTTLDSRW